MIREHQGEGANACAQGDENKEKLGIRQKGWLPFYFTAKWSLSSSIIMNFFQIFNQNFFSCRLYPFNLVLFSFNAKAVHTDAGLGGWGPGRSRQFSAKDMQLGLTGQNS